MPIRKITSESFDAILSVLGDDPVIQSSAHSSSEPDLAARQQNKSAGQAAQAETNGSANPHPPPLRHDFIKLAQWMPSLMGFICLGALAWIISVLIALEQNISTQFGVQEAKINLLSQSLTEQEETLFNNHVEFSEQINNIHTAQLTAATRSTKSAKNPIRPETLELNRKLKMEEAALSRWQYLGMSTTAQGAAAFFNNGDKTISLVLHATAMGTWVLTEIGVEQAKITSAAGQVITLQLRRHP